jgi:membrane-bound ClpP family serine protease
MRTQPRRLVAAMVVFLPVCLFADTVTNKNTGEILHGYITSSTDANGLAAYSVERGVVSLARGIWDVKPDRLGRNNRVVIITLEGQLSLQMVAEAFDEAVAAAADAGPLFIVIEINSPGGRADYVERICDRLRRVKYCPVVAFVKAGRYGGAVGSTAAIALACEKIFMAPNTTMGAATVFDRAYAFGGPKLSVAWQEYLGRLAEEKGRPRLLAMAMVDKDIEVVEVSGGSGRRFIRPGEAEPNETVVRLWSRGGSLLTLTAAEAVETGIAEAIAADRAQLLRELDAAGAEIVVDDRVNEAFRTFRKVALKFARLRNALDGQIKKVEQTDNLDEAINLLREIKSEYGSLLSLARRYPDLYLDVDLIEQQLASAQDYYRRAKSKRAVDSNSAGADH